jgi:hypothetical protein
MKTSFQARVTFDSVTPIDAEMKEWTIGITFFDADGAFLGTDIAVGDVISVDTSIYETGTFSFYTVSSIVTPDPVNPVLTMTYMDAHDHIFGAPDASTFIGMNAIVSRPSTNYGLLPVVSRDFQGVTDKFTEYVQNYNFTKIVDNLPDGTYKKINGDFITLFRGMPVVIDSINYDNVIRGNASNNDGAQIIGVVSDESILMNTIGKIMSKGLINQPTNLWDSLTGETDGLVGGKDYFLRNDVAGGITRFPPTTGFIVKIGKAISATTLSVDVEPPIEL